MSSLFLCFLKASRETLPMNALIVYILVENIKNIENIKNWDLCCIRI